MAITINVNGVTSGGGTQQNQPQPTQGGSATQPTSGSYERPDFSKYAPADTNPPKDVLPSSDRLAADIVNEMQQRGISIVPGSANYDNLLETLKGQRGESLLGDEYNRYNDRMSDIDNRRDYLMLEINNRIKEARKQELDQTTDPEERKKINDTYDRLADSEERHATSFFQKEFDAEEKRHTDEIAEIEKRLAEAIQKLSTQTSQGQTVQGGAGGAGGQGGQGGSGGTPPPPPPFIPYQRPDYDQYKPNASTPGGAVMPTTDRLVGDIRAEITRRGVMLIPGTQNFNTMMNTLQQQQRSNLMGQIDNQRDARLQDIDKRADSLMDEIKTRVDISRASELAGSDPLLSKSINDRWDKKLERERTAAGAMFEREEAAVNAETDQQRAEAEQNLTEAIQRLTEELSQGNKDSYLNQLRDKYKEQIWMRDNAATKDEVREHSREAAKIQERMQRAMNPGASQAMMRWLGVAGTVGATAINTGVQLDRNAIQQDYVGLSMASSILNGNATAAIRQQNALKEQRNTALYSGIGTAGGALIGAGIGSMFGGVGAVPGWAIGALIGTLAGTGVGTLGSHLANRSLFIEDERTQAADLWKQEEQRMMGFNDLVMLTRGRKEDIESVRNYYINSSGEKSMAPIWGRSAINLDLYDLGYTAPEFAQQVSRRIKQRGFANNADENALYADALERVFSMSNGALGQLSAYDRFSSNTWFVQSANGKIRPLRNNANRDFTNLAYTLAELGTTGMEEGSWARSDEFAGYMSQLQQQQRSTFLTVDNQRAARQVATGQKIFGDKFGAEAMQGIQQVNSRIQNPGGGFAKTLLYDVIQEVVPETRGRIDLIQQVQYGYLHPEKQNEIQQEYQKRINQIYGGVNTAGGYLANKEIWGIENPNIMMPIVNQLSRKGGLEAQQLNTEHSVKETTSVLTNGYTPKMTQRINAAADEQMKSLLGYQDKMTKIVNNILKRLEDDISKKLDEAVSNLK